MAKIKFEVSKVLLEQMAECIYLCSWVSEEEILKYMMGCIADVDYDPEEWSKNGRGLQEKNRIIEG